MASVTPSPSIPNNFVLQETAKFVWTPRWAYELFDRFIPRIGGHETAKSPKFSPPNSLNQFDLGFHYFCDFDTGDLMVNFSLGYHGSLDEAFFRYRLSVLRPNGVKLYTREYYWNHSRPLYGLNPYKFSSYNSAVYISRDEYNKLLVNGYLKIYCEVEIFAEPIQSRHSQFESFGKSSQIYEKQLECRIYWGDFIVLIGDKEFRVHKKIFTTRSSVFAALFERADPFGTADSMDGKRGRVVIGDVSADVFELLIRYIYTGKVADLGEHAAGLLAAAHKYKLNHLKSICKPSLIASLTAGSNRNAQKK